MSEQPTYPKFFDAGVLWPNNDPTKGEHIDYGEIEINGQWFKARVFQNSTHRKLQVRTMLNHEIDRAIKAKNDYEARRNSQAHQNLQNISQQIQGNPNLGGNPSSQPVPPSNDDEIPF